MAGERIPVPLVSPWREDTSGKQEVLVYLHRGRVYVQGFCYASLYDGDHRAELSTLVAPGGIPAKYRPSQNTQVRLFPDPGNSFGDEQTRWQSTVGTDGSWTLTPNTVRPILPRAVVGTGFYLDGVSWNVTPRNDALLETVALDPYLQPGWVNKGGACYKIHEDGRVHLGGVIEWTGGLDPGGTGGWIAKLPSSVPCESGFYRGFWQTVAPGAEPTSDVFLYIVNNQLFGYRPNLVIQYQEDQPCFSLEDYDIIYTGDALESSTGPVASPKRMVPAPSANNIYTIGARFRLEQADPPGTINPDYLRSTERMGLYSRNGAIYCVWDPPSNRFEFWVNGVLITSFGSSVKSASLNVELRHTESDVSFHHNDGGVLKSKSVALAGAPAGEVGAGATPLLKEAWAINPSTYYQGPEGVFEIDLNSIGWWIPSEDLEIPGRMEVGPGPIGVLPRRRPWLG